MTVTSTSTDPSQLRYATLVNPSVVISPTLVDLRPMFPPVFNQGASPSDISGALVSAFQFIDPNRFAGSRLFLDYVTQSMMQDYETNMQKQNPTDAQILFSVVALETYGMPSEADCLQRLITAGDKPWAGGPSVYAAQSLSARQGPVDCCTEDGFELVL